MQFKKNVFAWLAALAVVLFAGPGQATDFTNWAIMGDGSVSPSPVPGVFRLSGIVDGIYANDATTVGQMNAAAAAAQNNAINSANAYTNSQITNLTNQITTGALGACTSSGGTLQCGGATASAANTVALGQGSVASRANTVAVGDAGAERQVTSVAAGTESTDAVNVQQLQDTAAQTLTDANTYTDSKSTQTLIDANTYTDNKTAQTLIDANTYTDSKNAQTMSVVNQLATGALGTCTSKNGSLQCSVQGEASATADGRGSVAVGIGANSQGAGTMAIGEGSQAAFDGSVAIGKGAKALADPTTAVGNNAVATGNNAVALGANTTAAGENSVALGQGSVARRANTVSVGDVGAERQITNVAPGIEGTDAVNVNQLKAATGGLLDEAAKHTDSAVAQVLSIPQPMIEPGDTNALAAGIGSYGSGSQAFGVAYAHKVANRWQFNLGLGLTPDTGEIASRFGLNFSF